MSNFGCEPYLVSGALVYHEPGIYRSMRRKGLWAASRRRAGLVYWDVNHSPTAL